VASRQGSGVFRSRGCIAAGGREQNRILLERIGMLLTSPQMKVDLETVVKLVRQRGESIKEPSA